MDIQNTFLIVVVFLDLFFGVLLIRQNYKNEINISYSLLVFWLMIWTLGIAVFRFTSDHSIMLYSNQMFIISAALIFSSIWHFSLVFPYPEKKITNLKRLLIYLPNILIIIAVFIPGVMIKDIVAQNWGNESILGWGYVYYGIYLAFISLIAFKNLWLKYRKLVGSMRVQIVYTMVGVFISVIFGATFNLIFILLGNYKYIWLGPYASFIMVAIIGYAIVVHRLMDVKLVLRKYSVYLFSLLVILIPAIGIRYLIALYISTISTWVDFIILIIAIAVYTPIRNCFYKLANKYFFSSLYDTQEVISELSDQLRSTLSIDNIYESIYNTLDRAFHLQAFGVLSYDQKKKVYNLDYNEGFKVGKTKKFPGNDQLHNTFIRRDKPIVLEEIKESHLNKRTRNTIQLLSNLKVAVLAPLRIKDKTVGLLALGYKESNEMYNDEDLRVLDIIGAQVAIAIENAILYEETLQFNKKLKLEVKKATEELRQANIELKQLDQAKSDFISIASHQLRTPLTVIKGYVSMMLQGDYGKIPKKRLDILDMVYQSNERLVNLVENLLNISRIESGRLKFRYETLSLDEISDSVVKELESVAKKKGLKLEYEKAAKLPKMEMDREKIRQVVMNLTDNAIKYTKTGYVHVSVEKEKNLVRFCVNDSGTGIKSDDLPNLFKKFSRGTGSFQIHTEGTGLGLYVAKEMIEAHKGRIWAESEGLDKGAKFCFELPIR